MFLPISGNVASHFHEINIYVTCLQIWEASITFLVDLMTEISAEIAYM